MKSRKQPFGQLLKKLRLSRGLTQRELAEQTGLTQSEISRLESRTTMPGSYRTMTRLIALFPELDPNNENNKGIGRKASGQGKEGTITIW